MSRCPNCGEEAVFCRECAQSAVRTASKRTPLEEAAEDLLEACKWLLEALLDADRKDDHQGDYNDEITAARAAIAKAEPEQPKPA